jgi:hypothetical protein
MSGGLHSGDGGAGGVSPWSWGVFKAIAQAPANGRQAIAVSGLLMGPERGAVTVTPAEVNSGILALWVTVGTGGGRGRRPRNLNAYFPLNVDFQGAVDLAGSASISQVQLIFPVLGTLTVEVSPPDARG